MPSTVATMSKQELARMISNAVEQKLVELFGDPDEGLVMKEHLRKRLIRQKKAVTKGDRGTDLSSIRKQFGSCLYSVRLLKTSVKELGVCPSNAIFPIRAAENSSDSAKIFRKTDYSDKLLEKLDRTVAKRIVARLAWLSENLDSTKLFPLKGELGGLFKLRKGSHHIIIEILRSENTIIDHAIGHRRQAYKRR